MILPSSSFIKQNL